MSQEQPSYPEPVRPQSGSETPADAAQAPVDAAPPAVQQAPQTTTYATPGAYPAQPVYTAPANPANPLAVTSMICSFVAPASWLLSWIPVIGVVLMVLAVVAPILAVIFGHIALSQIKKSTQGGRGMALTGLIIGYITIGLTVLLLVILIIGAVILGGSLLAVLPALATS